MAIDTLEMLTRQGKRIAELEVGAIRILEHLASLAEVDKIVADKLEIIEKQIRRRGWL